MNRKDRRAQPVSQGVPISMMLHCPGMHSEGCPDKASIAWVVGFSMKDSFTLGQLQTVLQREGWQFLVTKLPHEATGQEVPAFDPVCDTCCKRFTQEMVNNSNGNIDPAALPFIRRTLGSETSS